MIRILGHAEARRLKVAVNVSTWKAFSVRSRNPVRRYRPTANPTTSPSPSSSAPAATSSVAGSFQNVAPSHKLLKGAIAGIAVAGVVVAALVGAAEAQISSFSDDQNQVAIHDAGSVPAIGEYSTKGRGDEASITTNESVPCILSYIKLG